MFLYFYNVAYALIYIKYASIHMKFISHYFTYSNKKKKKNKSKIYRYIKLLFVQFEYNNI